MAKKKYIKSQELKSLEKAYSEHLERQGITPKVKTYFFDRNEKELIKSICAYVNLINGCYAERVVSTGRHINKEGQAFLVRNNNTTGQADISMTVLSRSVRVEVKCVYTGDRYQSDIQKNYQVDIVSAYGIYYIARDFKSFCAWFKPMFTKIQKRFRKEQLIKGYGR